MRIPLMLGIAIIGGLLLGFALGFFAGKYTPPAPYHFLSSETTAMEQDKFLENQKYLRTNHYPLRDDLLIAIGNESVAVYFEDLTTGSWMGIRERDVFRGASLLKVVTIGTALRAVNDEKLRLEQQVTLNPNLRDGRFGVLYASAENRTFTVAELISAAAVASDNTAANALHNLTGTEAWLDTFEGMGMPNLQTDGSYVGVNAKGYGNLLRSLYHSSYLRRKHSDHLLNLLAHTEFADALTQGVPPGVEVAHKIGVYTVAGNTSEKQYHDCGIIYTEHPYILCVMTRGMPEQDAKRLIATISKKTYDYRMQ